MNTCPQCGTTYTDTSLRFCLADGAALSSSSEAETIVSGRHGGIKVEIPAERQPQPSQASPPPPKNSILPKIILGLFVVFLLITVVIGGAGAIYYFAGTSNNNTQSNLTTPTPVPTATPDAEKERLRNELANLQKKLDERAAAAANKQPTQKPDEELDKARIATVNSPGDGFLALRTEPGTETGDRIAQIPHGSQLEVISCEPKSVKIGVRTGKWCLTEWNGRAGWVFDAWLIYR